MLGACRSDPSYRQLSRKNMKLLVVDDEAPIREALAYNFQRKGFEVVTAGDVSECMRAAREWRPNLIILDVMLPSGSGFDVCRALRAQSSVPIILLTARAQEFDRVLGLELGADDYVVKPFSMREITARAHGLLRRLDREIAENMKPFSIGPLQIEPSNRRVTRNGEELTLPPRAAGLLCFLAAHPGQVFTRDALLDRVWGADAFVTERTVDVHVRWIREKIEEDPANPRLIVTVRGLGYKFSG